MYLPVAALFLIQVRGFSVADAGLALGVGAGVGLLLPVLAGTLVDRVGPRRVIGTGQLLRAIAMLVYLLVPGWPGAIAGSAICAAGMQLHYGSLYAFLTALRPSDGFHDAQFARVEMVRSAGYGAGALLGAVLLAWDPAMLPWLLAVKLVTSTMAAILVFTMRMPPHTSSRSVKATSAAPGVLRNRPFLGLILLGFLITLVMEFFPVAFPVIAVEQLGAPAWLPSLANAGLAMLSSTLTGVAVALTSSRSRAFAVRLGAVLLLAWIASMVAVYAVPSAWLAVALFGSALIFGVGTVVLGTRMNAAASEAAPPEQAGRYLAAFQYSFSVASLTAPLLMSAFALSGWLPWVLLVLGPAGALVLLPWLRRALPPRVLALAPDETEAGA